MSIKGKILLHGQTDIGSVRDHNEDAIAIDNDIALAILADGMGGHLGGEMASAITVSTIKDILAEKVKSLASEKTDTSTIYSPESLLIQDAIMQANTLECMNPLKLTRNIMAWEPLLLWRCFTTIVSRSLMSETLDFTVCEMACLNK